jgi:uncharacterized protein
VLYSAFDPDDLEDADELLALIDTLEPPADMAQAVEDLVRSVLLIADVTRPATGATRPAPGRRPGARPGNGPRSGPPSAPHSGPQSGPHSGRGGGPAASQRKTRRA